MKKILIVLATFIISITAIDAQKGKVNWQKIGETTVDFKTDKGVINISNADNFKSLSIKTDAPVHIDNLTIVYQDGEPEIIPVRYDFKAGIASRAIDLEGYNRKIKEIDFAYKTVPNWKGDKANVAIMGLK